MLFRSCWTKLCVCRRNPRDSFDYAERPSRALDWEGKIPRDLSQRGLSAFSLIILGAATVWPNSMSIPRQTHHFIGLPDTGQCRLLVLSFPLFLNFSILFNWIRLFNQVLIGITVLEVVLRWTSWLAFLSLRLRFEKQCACWVFVVICIGCYYGWSFAFHYW